MNTAQTTLEQAKTVLVLSWILALATKVRLRYKRIEFHSKNSYELYTQSFLLSAPSLPQTLPQG